jgi:aryl-alcohol dehydrogenase-like predicted oxidoreductase
MKTRTIGSLPVSSIGLGCNNMGRNLDARKSARLVGAALDAGINFFDTADAYGEGASEHFLGSALASHRDNAVIATKFGAPFGDSAGGAAPVYIRSALKKSLRRLGTEYVDLFFLHMPDPHTPIDETLGCLAELVQEGHVKEVGCSNFGRPEIVAACAAASKVGLRVAAVQNKLNLIHTGDCGETLATCRAQGVSYIPYWPLANGALAGRYRPGEGPVAGSRLSRLDSAKRSLFINDRTGDLIAKLEAWARQREHSVRELAIAWLLALDPVATVICGASSYEQVSANARATGWELSQAEMDEIARLISAP